MQLASVSDPAVERRLKKRKVDVTWEAEQRPTYHEARIMERQRLQRQRQSEQIPYPFDAATHGEPIPFGDIKPALQQTAGIGTGEGAGASGPPTFML